MRQGKQLNVAQAGALATHVEDLDGIPGSWNQLVEKVFPSPFSVSLSVFALSLYLLPFSHIFLSLSVAMHFQEINTSFKIRYLKLD